ncbi:glutamate-1-semialdehyde 2,1-aminomutase [Labilibaculum sp. A4]|uniref:glutamate-1-semialdehyde 2,1-aminomutase n=1 Tax=Labilibaculum euxinus TaxID=2686357 RepID=UPI000F61DC32|nr:glutamate-1-semialdehyde 2,1-aminomutase [Labilibaculum euxinus]MDQ1770327.1 glutamate-1-semialdehyde 2,1-aminomutase [Labilibaculum euxinus]MWN75454.1 glutamate-1-semialdehyde 2,1-aminomutase [Labilibaculum euxinus]
MHQYKRSSELFTEANKYIPGGVNSPVRAFKSVGGTPVFIKKAKGSILTDVDGNEYIDYISSWGPMILGHAYPKVIDAIKAKVEDSTSFGAPTELEIEIAKLIVDMVPNIDKVRMVNSGTEACMSAIRVARGYTGRNKFIKFEGCYHGHADSFLIKAGSGASTFGVPNSPGVTPGTANDTLTAKYNNIEDVKQLAAENKGEIAAVIVEAIAGNMGCVLPKKGFLEDLRELCDKEGILLIFDEVMSGFRLGKGGAQEYFGVNADLVTFGKVIGGGMPVGAYAGPDEIMKVVSPVGPVYQAGTLSGNPIAMIAGLTLLKELNENPHYFTELADKTEYLHKGLDKVLSESGFAYKINRCGSMISVFFTDVDVVDFDTAATANNENFPKFFHEMLKRGIYLPPSSFESYFLSNSLTYEMLDKTIQAAKDSLEAMK